MKGATINASTTREIPMKKREKKFFGLTLGEWVLAAVISSCMFGMYETVQGWKGTFGKNPLSISKPK